jgi:hypothetical protein
VTDDVLSVALLHDIVNLVASSFTCVEYHTV